MHLGGKNMHFREKSGELQVINRHDPLGVGVRYKSGLRLREKWVTPDKPLALWVLADTPMIFPEASVATSQVRGKRVELAKVSWSVFQILHELVPGAHIVLDHSLERYRSST